MAPTKYTKAQMLTKLKQVSGGAVPNALIGDLLNLKKKGYRRAEGIGTVWLKPSKVADTKDERGIQVFVTVCQDQRVARVIDKSGAKVPAYERVIPPYLLRQYSVRKPAGSSTWRVYGTEVVKGACP